MLPLKVAFPVPLTTSVPTFVLPLIVVVPPKVVNAVLLTVTVRELAPEVEAFPLKVKALLPPIVVVPANTRLFAIVRAPPPACKVDVLLMLKAPLPSAPSLPEHRLLSLAESYSTLS